LFSMPQICLISHDKNNFMISPIKNLAERDRKILIDMPLLVSMWVGVSDNHFDASEQERAVKTIKTKTFSEEPEIADLYKMIENPESRLAELMDILPLDLEEQKEAIKAKLEEGKAVMQKLDEYTSNHLFLSLKNVAVHVANATGGFAGMGNIEAEEKEAIRYLDFLKP